MREAEFYAKLRAPLNRLGDHDRVENRVVSGMPDVNWAIGGVEGWLELKMYHAGWLYFEKAQLPWYAKRTPHSHAIFVAAYDESPHRIDLFRAVDLLKVPREPYRKWTRMRPTYADRALTMMPRYDWRQFADTLTARR